MGEQLLHCGNYISLRSPVVKYYAVVVVDLHYCILRGELVAVHRKAMFGAGNNGFLRFSHYINQLIGMLSIDTLTKCENIENHWD
jgi:hypothetical protein